jgi:hypothetical protein
MTVEDKRLNAQFMTEGRITPQVRKILTNPLKLPVKRSKKSLWMFVVLSGLAHSSPPPTGSMFSPAELDILGLQKQQGLGRGEWRLDGILYQSETQWTIWLNGHPYTPQHHPDGIIIVSVTPHHVTIKPAIDEEDDSEISEDTLEDNAVLRPEVYTLTIEQIARIP